MLKYWWFFCTIEQLLQYLRGLFLQGGLLSERVSVGGGFCHLKSRCGLVQGFLSPGRSSSKDDYV